MTAQDRRKTIDRFNASHALIVPVEGKMVKVEEIAKGEFVRRKVGGKTFQRGSFDRSTRRYSLVDCDDVNREVWVKKGTLLHVGFTY